MCWAFWKNVRCASPIRTTRPWRTRSARYRKEQYTARRTWRFTAAAKKQLAELDAGGFGRLPVCIAKTQYSFSDDASLLAAPSGFTMTVRELRLSAGAGFVVVVMGNIMTMPGLPKKPAAERHRRGRKRRHQRPVLSAFWQTPHKKAYANSAAPKAHLWSGAVFLHLFSGRFTAPYRENPSNAGFWGCRRTPPERPPP